MDRRRVYDPISDPTRIPTQCIHVQVCTIYRIVSKAMDYEFPKPSTVTVKNILETVLESPKRSNTIYYLIFPHGTIILCIHRVYSLSSCIDAVCIVQLATIYDVMGYE
jgi:hypothetical protein